MYATLAGDVTICSAYSHELPKFGMKAGLTTTPRRTRPDSCARVAS